MEKQNTSVKKKAKKIEYEIQGNYGCRWGWKMVTTEDNFVDAKIQLKYYNENEPEIRYRIKAVSKDQDDFRFAERIKNGDVPNHFDGDESEFAIEPPNEAASCVRCKSCNGFRLPNKDCNYCKGR